MEKSLVNGFGIIKMEQLKHKKNIKINANKIYSACPAGHAP